MIEEDSLRYLHENGIDTLFDLQKRLKSSVTATVDGSITDPFPAGNKIGDLARLHRLCRVRKVTTVLEFGVGYSTQVIAHALAANKQQFGEYVADYLRRGNPFELHSVDDINSYVQVTKNRLQPELVPYVHFHVSPVQMTTFSGRICTEYQSLPNICPDLIYIDGPSLGNVTGDINGISTAHIDRLPMMCDILKIEHFLLPGSLIVVDGRAGNARFIKANLQRNWVYYEDPIEEVHFFELQEQALGMLNNRQIEFSLPNGFMVDPAYGLKW